MSSSGSTAAAEVKALLHREIQPALDDNIQVLSVILDKTADLVRRNFLMDDGCGAAGVLFYIDGLVNSALLDESVLRPLIIDTSLRLRTLGAGTAGSTSTAEDVANSILVNPDVKLAKQFAAAIDGLLAGEGLIFIDGIDRAFLVGTKGWEKRSPSETATEVVVRGPRDGFTENIRTNTALIRRRVKDPMLRVLSLSIGERSKTTVNVMYIEDVVKEGLVDEVMQRLSRIKMDVILESGYLEEMIQDSPLSPFSTIRSTERPDTVAGGIAQGKVAILTDTTPFALLVPMSFVELLVATDDYYFRIFQGTFSRVVRYIAFIISLTLPSLYVLLVSFHQEMIPTQLALSMAAGRESVPFPVLLEVLVMEMAFELMREAGLRMPRPMGQAVSIVGSLIIGQAAVQAGLVSPIMVIVVAVTGISSFAIPSYENSFAIRLLRFPLLLASGTLGLLGFAGVLYIITVHLLSLRSFGEPFLAPYVPMRPTEMQDSLVRAPWWTMNKRPSMAQDQVKAGSNNRPHPPKHPQGGTGKKQQTTGEASPANSLFGASSGTDASGASPPSQGGRRVRKPRKLVHGK